MGNDFMETSPWEHWATRHLPQKFGMNVVKITDDYKTNHDEGTDAFVKNFCGQRFCRVDFKWNRMFDYKTLFFSLEKESANGDSWTKNEKAVKLGVIIVCPWKNEENETFKLCAYRLSDLVKLIPIKEMGTPPRETIKTHTKYWRLDEDYMEPYCIWESEYVSLEQERKEWKEASSKQGKTDKGYNIY